MPHIFRLPTASVRSSALLHQQNGEIKFLVVKVVDDGLFAGGSSEVEMIVRTIGRRYIIENFVHAPPRLLFFGLHSEQKVDIEITGQAHQA